MLSSRVLIHVSTPNSEHKVNGFRVISTITMLSIATAPACVVVPGDLPQQARPVSLNNEEFLARIDSNLELAKSAFVLTDHLISAIDGQLNENKYASLSNAFSLTAEILKDKIAADRNLLGTSPVGGPAAGRESLRARELSDQRATVLIQSIATSPGSREEIGDIRITLQVITSDKVANFAFMEIPAGSAGKIVIHLDGIDSFFEHFTKYSNGPSKRFHASGTFTVAQTRDSLEILAEELVSAGPTYRFHLEQFLISGESFQKLRSITTVAEIETESGLESRNLKMGVSEETSGVENISGIATQLLEMVK